MNRHKGKVVNPNGCEINIVDHCNLSCRSCSHLSPLMRKVEVEADSVNRDLSLLAKSYQAGFVKILGGEPLLHRDLLSVLDAVRESRIANRIVVATNGKMLHRMSPGFWRKIDQVEVSEYPGSEPDLSHYDHVLAMSETYRVPVQVFRYEYFRESYTEEGTADSALVQRIFDTCKLAHDWFCHTIAHGYFYLCPQSVYLRRVGVVENGGSDGLEIADDDGFAERLQAYINRSSPLRACGSCLGSVGRLLPHQQVPRREWRTHQGFPTEPLVDRAYLELLRTNIHAPDGCAVPDDGSSLETHVAARRAGLRSA